MENSSVLICHHCGGKLMKIWFTEEERNKNNVPTGRVRRACSHLECEFCGHKEAVDDSFDEPWVIKRSGR